MDDLGVPLFLGNTQMAYPVQTTIPSPRRTALQLLARTWKLSIGSTVDGSEIRRSPVDIIIYRVLYIPGIAGFLLSTVCFIIHIHNISQSYVHDCSCSCSHADS